jgi:hypothetical protein
MGRPIVNNLSYFKHEITMRNDPKMKVVRAKYGDEGYAVYCMMLEYLSEKEMLQAPFDDDELEIMAVDFDKNVDRLKELIEFFTKKRIELIQIEEGFIRCRQLDKRAKSVFDDRRRNLLDLRASSVKLSAEKLSGNSEKLPNNQDSILEYSIEENSIEENSKVQYMLVFDHWNSKDQLIHHKNASKGMIKNISDRLKEFQISDLNSCIDNYALILSDTVKYWYTYKHALDEFFRSGERKPAPYMKFLPERFVEENFLIKGFNNGKCRKNMRVDNKPNVNQYDDVR